MPNGMPKPLPKHLYLYYKSCIKQLTKTLGWYARSRSWSYAFCMTLRRLQTSRSWCAGLDQLRGRTDDSRFQSNVFILRNYISSFLYCSRNGVKGAKGHNCPKVLLFKRYITMTSGQLNDAAMHLQVNVIKTTVQNGIQIQNAEYMKDKDDTWNDKNRQRRKKLIEFFVPLVWWSYSWLELENAKMEMKMAGKIEYVSCHEGVAFASKWSWEMEQQLEFTDYDNSVAVKKLGLLCGIKNAITKKTAGSDDQEEDGQEATLFKISFGGVFIDRNSSHIASNKKEWECFIL
ncbi:hypothetical protein LXL04_007660 [Taraxacum kok-saghyz]